MKNPFTHTPGRVGDANITTTLEEKIYENFMYPQPSESVYKITGIRGSGKTVIFGNILRHYRTKEMKADGWRVYDLSAARNHISTLISYLLLEPEVKKALLAEKTNLSVSIPLVGINAGIDIKTEYDDEVRLEQLIGIMVREKKKIIIGIDDIAKTDATTEFCSVFAKLIRNTMEDEIAAPWPVYLICSGVYQNFYALGEVPYLTFFKRAAVLKTEPFPIPAMAVKYEDIAQMDEEEAISFAKMTRGFAYAYQVFGSAYFEHRDKGEEYVLKQAKSELFSQCYEKIWKELPDGEREILKTVSTGPKKRKEVLEELKGKGGYQVNSTALKKMGLLVDSSEAYGRAEITLPFFGEYIHKYC